MDFNHEVTSDSSRTARNNERFSVKKYNFKMTYVSDVYSP